MRVKLELIFSQANFDLTIARFCAEMAETDVIGDELFFIIVIVAVYKMFIDMFDGFFDFFVTGLLRGL